MKKTKKLSSLILAFVLVLLSTVSAFATTTPELEDEILGHTFDAYQIFEADSVDGEYLTNVEWGSSISNSSYFLRNLKRDNSFVVDGVNIFAECTDADSVANVLSEYEDYSDIAKAFANYAANSTYVKTAYATDLMVGDEIEDAGYYVLVDTTTSGPANPAIIKMLIDGGTLEIEVKAGVPYVEKKVKENSYDVDYTSETLGTETKDGFVGVEYGEGYNDVADYSIGEAVPFRLYGTIASDMEYYDSYYYAFIDELSKGLTFTDADVDDLTVSLYDVSGDSYVFVDDVTDYFEVSYVDSADGTVITIECADAREIPEISSTSVLVVDYNATLNQEAVIGYNGNENKVYLKYSNNPNVNKSTGTTEEDKVIVFTYEVVGTKTDTEGNVLEGAKFNLLNADGEYYAYSEDGVCWVTDKKNADVLESDEDGLFTVKGLDEGEYTLVEVEAPKAYQMLTSDIIINIISTILPDDNDDDAQNWTGDPEDALIDFAASVENDDNAASLDQDATVNGSVAMNVINTKVYDLPGTGGMGTTLIYIAGASFVALAVVLFVIKRRKSA
ncbi:MAG: SpaA isopeptide-forming pilin-related protein [Ruminococcus sp.]|nr:SpaA isopeptide-forming pilin-related protein [Ruminococcus sp.]